jgi:SAM-dependent methyltransferase
MKSPHASGWSDHPELTAFYSVNRNRPEDLYPSEQRFLPWLAKQSDSVLDTGCAAGGFSKVWRKYNKDIVYTGIDLSSSLIQTAKDLFPDLTFLQGNVVEGIDLPDRYADLVQALGWLNWEPNYCKAMNELWRLTKTYLFLDVRLTVGENVIVTTQKLSFNGDWDGAVVTPYVVVPWKSFASILLTLKPVAIFGFGYWGKPAKTVNNFDGQVCFSTFVLKKANGINCSKVLPQVCLDLPLEWPVDLEKNVEILPSTDIEVLVPRAQD